MCRVAPTCENPLPLSTLPHQLNKLVGDSDPERARRAMEAMLEMGKIDVAELQRAADAP